MADVDLSQAVLLIRESKFYKSRLVPIGAQLQQAMARFARARNEAGHSAMPDLPFFIGRKRGSTGEGGARHQPRLHNLRHAFCVNRRVAAYETGANFAQPVPKLSTYLGHISLGSAHFEACSGFTHVTARRIARPPKAVFVTRLRLGQLPIRAARAAGSVIEPKKEGGHPTKVLGRVRR